MKTVPAFLFIIFNVLLYSCKSSTAPSKTDHFNVYVKEPDDSADYKYLKYDFYLTKGGQLCERKVAMARPADSACNCEFVVYYDSIISISTDNIKMRRPLSDIVDISSFVEIDSTLYSKDKNRVFYFYGNAGGGSRAVVKKADPGTFKSLCEYRWGVDKNYVFYETQVIEGLDLKSLQVLSPVDSSHQFSYYIKDEKNVYFVDGDIVPRADAKTFKMVGGQKWDAEDKNYKYLEGKQR